MERRFDGMIGAGGIGSGRFFALDGNHTLGREESRSGRFLDRRDYCKLHIVCHYVQALLGPEFTTICIGRVGEDEAGTRLLAEMAAAGLDIRYVSRGSGEQTLFALCLIYPDGSGGNLTVNDSACARVDAGDVAATEPEFARFRGLGIALALPEVPLVARKKLLALGTAYGFLRVAAFTSAEIAESAGRLDEIDLLALNLDEAAALARIPAAGGDPETVVRAALARIAPASMLTVTAAAAGSWSWDGTVLAYLPALPVPVVSTAGAGDAHLAGTLVGLVGGLSLRAAHQLGVLVAAVSTTSRHTIDDRLNWDSLRACAAATRMPLDDATRELLAKDNAYDRSFR